MMKKIFELSSFIITLLLFFNCDNEPYEGDIINEDNACVMAIRAANEAGASYLQTDITDENHTLLCQIYRDAIEDQIEICGDPSSALKEIIDFLGDCTTVFDNPCANAEAATAIAFQEFLNAPTLDYESKCMAYIDAIENQIFVCGDDGSLQALINELGDCQPFVFDITGSWKLIAMNSNIGRDLNNDDVVTSDYFQEIECYTEEAIDFNSDGTGTFYFRSYAVVEISASNDNFDNVDYSIDCIDYIEDVQFTWTQIGLNSIVVTLTADGSVLNFFRNADHIFIVRRNDFVATSVSPNLDSVVQDLIYEYTQL